MLKIMIKKMLVVVFEVMVKTIILVTTEATTTVAVVVVVVFTTFGGMGPKAKCFYSKLADKLSEKKHQPRNQIVAWMRCRLSFSLLRSALLGLDVSNSYELLISLRSF